MGNAAHGESLEHDVYRTPFAVQPEFEYRDTPRNYYDRHLGTEALPKKMKVWRVQASDRNSVVARSYGFEDSPDAEVLALGFNRGKEYGAVGIGRHGNVLQWGYSDPPSQMTEAGRKLFLNCLHHIRRFDGKPPLVHTRASHRLNAIRLAGIINRITDDQDEFFLRTFSEALYEKYHSDPKGLTEYYRENIEWVYRDQAYKVDGELKSLGIDSNRKIDSLQRLVELLDDETHDEEAVRALLKRYTDVSFETAPQWRQWFEVNEDRIFFTDVGGYKFLVAPEESLGP